MFTKLTRLERGAEIGETGPSEPSETDRVTLPVHKMIKMTRQEQNRRHANACESAGNLRIRKENNVGVAI